MRLSNRALIGAILLLLGLLVLLGSQSSSPLADGSHSFESIRLELDTDIVTALNTTWLERSADWITVNISGVDDPRNDDWIGIFTSELDLQRTDLQTAPIKYKFANSSKAYLVDGAGSYQFSIVNPRQSVIVALVRNGFDQAAVVAAVSPEIRFRHPNEPQFPRWSLGPTPSTFRLSWVGGRYAEPCVHWGPAPDRLHRVSYAGRHRFGRDQMCGPPASAFGWQDPGYLYDALIEHIEPNAVVYYQFGSAETGFSDVLTFHALPAAGQTVRFYAYGDMGSGQMDGSLNAFLTEQASLSTSSLMSSSNFTADFVLHIGDISYAKGYLAQWDYFLWQIAPIASRIPYQTAIGNHERDHPDSGALFNGTDSGGECGVPYANYFPTPKGFSLSTPWYSFNAGAVHVLVMSTEHDFSAKSPQFSYLKRDLASVNREHTPWVIVVGHRPMYCDSSWKVGPGSDGEVALELRDALEQLLYDADVDLAIWGHNHSYQRTCSVLNEHCRHTKAPVHAVVGTAGFFLSKDGNNPAARWLMKRIDTFGISRITANPSELLFEFVLSENGTVADSFVLNKINIAVI